MCSKSNCIFMLLNLRQTGFLKLFLSEPFKPIKPETPDNQLGCINIVVGGATTRSVGQPDFCPSTLLGRIYTLFFFKSSKLINYMEKTTSRKFKLNKIIIYQLSTILASYNPRTTPTSPTSPQHPELFFFVADILKSSRFENSTEQNARGAHHVPDLSILEKFPGSKIYTTNIRNIKK